MVTNSENRKTLEKNECARKFELWFQIWSDWVSFPFYRCMTFWFAYSPADSASANFVHSELLLDDWVVIMTSIFLDCCRCCIAIIPLSAELRCLLPNINFIWKRSWEISSFARQKSYHPQVLLTLSFTVKSSLQWTPNQKFECIVHVAWAILKKLSSQTFQKGYLYR